MVEEVEDGMEGVLRILAWDSLWEEKPYRYSSYVFYLVALFLLDKIIIFLEGMGSG